MATKNKKCKHPPCNCQAAADSDYCSTECAAMASTPDVDCACRHAECTGKARAAGSPR